ncbi:MAG: cytoskeleton protein RodZ [Solirubrobacteraceae bacterium]|nr:cytoskeleton protein RodZ [Solirubrobacteraceae bacterium]
MRQRIDISEIESETKIRAKYLRALENEEWDLLPGPTYVKSFMRTYAEALGLDGKLLIEEYKLRHERLSDVEMQPIRPPGPARDKRRRRRGGGGGRRWAVAAVVAGLIVALYFLGSSGSDQGNDASSTLPAVSTATTTTSTARRPSSSKSSSPSKKSTSAAARRRRQQARLARLQIVPTGPVYVCLKRAGGGTVVNGRILQAGSRQPTYRSRRFRLLLGNSEVRLRINGRTRAVPPVASGIAYEITPRRIRTLPAGSRPRCST